MIAPGVATRPKPNTHGITIKKTDWNPTLHGRVQHRVVALILAAFAGEHWRLMRTNVFLEAAVALHQFGLPEQHCTEGEAAQKAVNRPHHPTFVPYERALHCR
jgi:hypothetical protein